MPLGGGGPKMGHGDLEAQEGRGPTLDGEILKLIILLQGRRGLLGFFKRSGRGGIGDDGFGGLAGTLGGGGHGRIVDQRYGGGNRI